MAKYAFQKLNSVLRDRKKSAIKEKDSEKQQIATDVAFNFSKIVSGREARNRDFSR